MLGAENLKISKPYLCPKEAIRDERHRIKYIFSIDI